MSPWKAGKLSLPGFRPICREVLAIATRSIESTRSRSPTKEFPCTASRRRVLHRRTSYVASGVRVRRSGVRPGLESREGAAPSSNDCPPDRSTGPRSTTDPVAGRAKQPRQPLPDQVAARALIATRQAWKQGLVVSIPTRPRPPRGTAARPPAPCSTSTGARRGDSRSAASAKNGHGDLRGGGLPVRHRGRHHRRLEPGRQSDGLRPAKAGTYAHHRRGQLRQQLHGVRSRQTNRGGLQGPGHRDRQRTPISRPTPTAGPCSTPPTSTPARSTSSTPTSTSVTLPAGAFTDPNLPKGYAPFNVQELGGKLYVTYAKQDADKHDDVAGPRPRLRRRVQPGRQPGLPGGIERLVSGGALNSPWGLASGAVELRQPFAATCWWATSATATSTPSTPPPGRSWASSRTPTASRSRSTACGPEGRQRRQRRRRRHVCTSPPASTTRRTACSAR